MTGVPVQTGAADVGALEALRRIIARDLLLAMRRKADVIVTLFFFVIAASLFPLGIGPETELLRKIAPGILWVSALLASMLSLGRMFSDDYRDGTLEQLLLSPQPLGMMVAGKIAAHWLVTGLPLVLVAPLLGLQFDLSVRTLEILMLSLLLGTPVLSLIGAIGAALTLGLRGGGVLVSLLVLPLYIPVLIFGAGGVQADISGIDFQAYFSILGALLVAALPLAPWAAGQALRIALE